MTMKNPNLHGNAPDKSDVALLLIDLINDLDFPEGKQLLEHALPAARRIVELKRRAKAACVPVVYVNDNFGLWQSNFMAQVEHCLHDDVLGRPLAEMLHPADDDYFVLKPKHSGFYSTTLDLLLKHLGAQTVIVTGLAGNICVLFTANDAYQRDLKVVVPADCTASNTADANRAAIAFMADVLKADVRESTTIRFPSSESTESNKTIRASSRRR
jgi:nicotinamidase-related amidase